MSLMKSEIEATHRIWNQVNMLSKNYFGRKTITEAKKFVSTNKWIMFPEKNMESLKEGIEYPLPNIYIAFEDEVIDNMKGQVNGFIGLTYNNKGSMEWFNTILSKHSSSFVKALRDMQEEWIISIEQKIKINCKDSAPVYKHCFKFNPKTVTIKDLVEAIKKSNTTLLSNGDIYEGDDVLWSIVILNIYKSTKIKSFDDDIIDIDKLFHVVLALS